MSPHTPDWEPTAGADMLRRRARLLADIRGFFDQRGVIEIETPYLSTAGATDPGVPSLRLDAEPVRYLHTSPEFPLKRLLAAGVGDCYSLGRVFRAGEEGRLHNPEFTLLEWYRLGLDHHGLMDEVAALVAALMGRTADPVVLSYAEAMTRVGLPDPHRAEEGHLRAALADADVDAPADCSRDGLLDLLMGAVVGPGLGHDGPCLVHDYPASQAALARIRDGDPPLAERFELYLGGMEIANGFHELTDATEQRRRFEAENADRRARGLEEVPMDQRLLAALEHGLPDCAGVAFGVDRFLMWLTGAEDIQEVIAFPWDRA